MIKFYCNSGPNPMKVALLLEELEVPYEPVFIDVCKGEQHGSTYTALNPNSKVPCIVDDGTVVFDSNAILLYLAEKAGKFMPPSSLRGEFLSWLMFIATGVGPYSGQVMHFRFFAPEPKEYAIQRYLYEANRHFNIVNDRLSQHSYMIGNQYTVVDMALWGWARRAPAILGLEDWTTLPHLQRLVASIDARPATQRVLAKDLGRIEIGPDAHKHLFRHMA